MKIAFNPSTVEALIAPPNNKDITFDLRGHNIFARGVKFCGTDTWRPVVDNLTSDSTTSSLSANQGRVLKSLIDGKSDSGHTHDDRYLRLTGGTMASNALITFADSGSWGTNNGPQGARGGLYWTGQSDYTKLYAEETAGDNLDLVIQFGDDNSNGLSIRNASNVQTSYISAGGVITTRTFKGNLDWSYITNKPSSYTPSAHTHAWNSLTHSSTTENQAILTNGKANGWKLYTLNISRWDNAANNAHSHANKSVLDGITSALVNNWNTAYTFVNTITGTDTDKVINKWDEIVNFLAGITEDNKLNTLLNSKLSVQQLSAKDILTTKTNNALFWVDTKGNASSITTGPFTDHPYALLSVTNYNQNAENHKFFYRSRLAFSSAGDIKVASCHHENEYQQDETWYNVLTSKNSGINGSTIKLNGTSITVYSSGTADGRYVKKLGDTMTGVLTIDTTNFGALIIKRNDDANGASIQFRGKSSVYGYIGLNNSTKDKQFLRWNSDTSKTYTILDTSSTYTSNGRGIINGTTITQVDNATNANNASVASKVYGQVGDTGTHELVRCDMNNDQFRIIAGSNGNNNGWAEIATADDGNEPIYVRQYTGVFSSVVRTLTLLDANGYTHFPSYINIGGNENNNSSPDRVWGSNGSDSYLRSYRTSALRVSYANSAGNADLLDGLDWNNFFLRRFYRFDLSSYSLSNFYPLFFVDSDIELDCEIHSDGGGWQDPFNQNRLHFQITSRGWTDTMLSFHLLSQDNYDNNEITIGSIGIGTYQGGICIWVRGGRTYRVYSNREPLFKSSNYTYGDEIYSVGTNIWGGTNTNVNIVWKNDSTRKDALIATLTDNVASATKLQTPRTLWYRNTFDGANDVNGVLCINTSNASGSFDEGIRILNKKNGWVSITMCGIDAGDSLNGTSNNTWAICNENGNFYITKRGSSSGQMLLGMTSNKFRIAIEDSLNGSIASSLVNYSNNSPYGLLTRIYNTGVVSLQSQRESNNGELFGLSLQPLGGNVGIGTTTPKHRLDVAGNIRATGQLFLPTNGNYNAILMGDDCWMGDCNIGDVIGLSGRNNANAGGIKFGKGGMYIGYNGSSHYSSSTSLWSNFNADLLDGYHENSFLRYRGNTSTDQEATLWSQIGIKQYNNALPDNLTGVYNYGSVISLPGSSSRFEIYASHQSSNGNGLYYRSGWGSDKKSWLKFIDSSNIGSQSVNYANSAGNADKLDGIHANSFLIDRGGNYSGLIYDLSCKSIFSGNNLSDAPTTGWVSGIVLGSNWNSSHYQHYLVESDSRWYATRVYSNGKMTNWNTFAYLTDNVASATNAYHLYINYAHTWSTWYWSGQNGQPSWLWGSNDGTNMYVWDPNNFNVHTAQYLRSLGNQNCQTGRTQNYGDVYSYNTIYGNTGAPIDYTSVIGFGRGTGGTVEIAGGWCNTGLYWRSLRDCCDDWYSWRTVLDSSNYTGYVNNYYWANVKISTSSSTTTSPTVSNLTATNSIKVCQISLENGNEINNTNGGIYLNYKSSGNIGLCQGGGNVGIGTTAPSYKLDVNGSAHIGGTLIINSILNFLEVGAIRVANKTIINIGSDGVDFQKGVSFNDTASFLKSINIRTGLTEYNAKEYSTSNHSVIIGECLNNTTFIFEPASDGQLLFMKLGKKYSNIKIQCTARDCIVVKADNFNILIGRNTTQNIYGDGVSRFFIYEAIPNRWIEFYCG